MAKDLFVFSSNIFLKITIYIDFRTFLSLLKLLWLDSYCRRDPGVLLRKLIEGLEDLRFCTL